MADAMRPPFPLRLINLEKLVKPIQIQATCLSVCLSTESICLSISHRVVHPEIASWIRAYASHVAPSEVIAVHVQLGRVLDIGLDRGVLV